MAFSNTIGAIAEPAEESRQLAAIVFYSRRRIHPQLHFFGDFRYELIDCQHTALNRSFFAMCINQLRLLGIPSSPAPSFISLLTRILFPSH